MSDLSLPGMASESPAAAPLGRRTLLLAFAAAVAVSFVLPVVPWGRTALLPFSLLGTWAHEMGHGIVGEIVGDFDKLVLLKGGGGYALISKDSGLEQVLVSAGGLLGPAFFGALMIRLAARERTAKWALAVLSVMVLVSVVFYVRGAFGFFAMAAIGLILGAIAFYAPTIVRVMIAGFIGVQFCLASWADRHYMFTKNFMRNGETLDSDTQNIADEWLLPYWVWGGLILGLSVLIMSWAFWSAWIKPLLVDDDSPAMA